MATLQTKIAELAEEFASGVLSAIRSSQLDELMVGAGAPAGRRTAAKADREESDAPAAPRAKRRAGRLARRSPEEIDAVVERIVATLKASPAGLRSEQLQKELDIDKREISGPITQALSAKKIRKTGQKRSTTYFASEGKVAPKPATAKAASRKSTPKVKAKSAPKKAAPKAKAKTPKKPAKAKLKSAPKKMVAKAAASKKSVKKSAPKAKKAVAIPSKLNGATALSTSTLPG